MPLTCEKHENQLVFSQKPGCVICEYEKRIAELETQLEGWKPVGDVDIMVKAGDGIKGVWVGGDGLQVTHWWPGQYEIQGQDPE